jgi:hypothetical protein
MYVHLIPMLLRAGVVRKLIVCSTYKWLIAR